MIMIIANHDLYRDENPPTILFLIGKGYNFTETYLPMKEIMDIISAFDKAESEGKQTALATVVSVEGSSYRKEGARMLITEDGELTGAISGGCLEGDALRKALFVMHEKKAKLVVYDTSNEDDVAVGFQLGCNGIIHVLIEPINQEEPIHPVTLLKEAITTRQPAVLTTIFSLSRNAEQNGTCLLLKADGTKWDRLNDKTITEEVMPDLAEALANDKSSIKNYVHQDKELTAFINIIKPQVSLVIIGAGNDAIPIVTMGELLGWKVTVADGRPNYANKKRFAASSCQVLVARPENIFSSVDVDSQAMFVLMTHNYNYDLAMLRLLLEREVRYIGVLGSKGKMKRMLEELKAEGIDTDKQLSKIYGPVGADIGAETPEEIALSIITEIQGVIRGRSLTHLRFQDASDHPHKTKEASTTN